MVGNNGSNGNFANAAAVMFDDCDRVDKFNSLSRENALKDCCKDPQDEALCEDIVDSPPISTVGPQGL